MNKKSKTIFDRLIVGIKKGILTPTLPDNISKFHNNPIIRIFRVLGGVGILLILTHRLEYLFQGSLYLIALSVFTFLGILFGIYQIFLSFFRIKHMIKVLKSGDLDVRNSPLDRLASIAAKIIWCGKGFCDVAAPVGVVFGGMAGLDELRKAKGLEPIFIPKLAEIILPNTDTENEFKKIRNHESVLMRNKMELDAYKEENIIVEKFEEIGIIDNDEAKAWRDSIKRNESMCQKDSKEINSKILTYLDKLNEIRNNKK